MDSGKETSILSGSDENTSSIRVETVFEAQGDGNEGEDKGFQGNVTPRRASAITLKTGHPRQSDGANSIPSDSNSTASSWASKDDLRRQKKQERGRKWSSIKKSRQEQDIANLGVSPPRPGGLKRSKTPTTNNLSAALFSEPSDSIEGEDLTASLWPPTVILNGEAGDGRGAVYPRQGRSQFNQQFQIPQQPSQQQEQQPSSFSKWLTEGMLETLNVVAGITLSTTGTILSPPIALTRAVIPSLLSIVVDALDAATPRRVQDWFRILSSSVYHFFVVLVAGSTERGKRFKNQITQVAHSFIEAWSAPEARQVVVDGMATWVKLADALHTPEMKIFLDQLGILGCRFGDALASGKSKELLLNFKDLVWTSIELASDDSTTLALAEVTAHLCHALKEVDDSFTHATPRSVRNAHNEKAYLNSSLMTKDNPFESMEKIILSSLGIDDNYDEREDNNTNESTDDVFDDVMSTEQSIPSNVAFRVIGETDNPLEIPNLEQTNENKKDDSNWEKYKERVDVNLLQRKIVGEGRPQSRLSRNTGESTNTKAYSRTKSNEFPSTTPSLVSDMNELEKKENMVEEYAKIEEDMEELRLPRDHRNPSSNVENRNPNNTKELYDKFERMETKESEKPSYEKFFSALDELMETKQIEKIQRIRDIAVAEDMEKSKGHANPLSGSRDMKARVRILRKGVASEEKLGSKAIREKYSTLRNFWKCPPLLQCGAIGILFLYIFWIGFGVYGMYTFFHQVVHFDEAIGAHSSRHEVLQSVQQQEQQAQPIYPSDFEKRFSSPEAKHDNREYEEKMRNYRQNEIVIRIVKEVVHVREDGSRIENCEKTKDAILFVDEDHLADDDVSGNVVIDNGNRKHETTSSLDGFRGKDEKFGSGADHEDIEKVQNCVVATMAKAGDDISSSDDLIAPLNVQEFEGVKECLTETFQE